MAEEHVGDVERIISGAVAYGVWFTEQPKRSLTAEDVHRVAVAAHNYRLALSALLGEDNDGELTV